MNIYLPLGALSVCLRFLEFLLSSFDFLVFFSVYCLLLLVATCSNWLPSSHQFQIPNLVFSNFDSCLLTWVSLLLGVVKYSSILLSCQIFELSDECAWCRPVTQIYCLCSAEHQTQSTNISNLFKTFKTWRLQMLFIIEHLCPSSESFDHLV